MLVTGSIVALVTPMLEDGAIDYTALHHLLDWHLQAGTAGLVIAGTTGESATLEAEEQATLIAHVVKYIAGKIPVIAGAGTNATRSTLARVTRAEQAGADACLLVTPYYNKPTQNGLYEHYKMIADNTKLPIILYNVPGRTGCDLLPETVERLAGIKPIIGIKEATGKIERIDEIKKRCPQLIIYSGDDATGLAAMRHGAQGIISVTANVAPQKMQAMCRAALVGDFVAAEKLNQELMLLHQRLFLEANPIPTKWALHHMQKITGGIRLPLLPLDSQYHQAVIEAMQYAGVSSS